MASRVDERASVTAQVYLIGSSHVHEGTFKDIHSVGVGVGIGVGVSGEDTTKSFKVRSNL